MFVQQENAHKEDAHWDFQQATEKHELYNNNDTAAGGEHARQHQSGRLSGFARHHAERVPFTASQHGRADQHELHCSHDTRRAINRKYVK